ncbi:helix-turn-helix domain-containing protein [Roseivivax isoporae]|uniref:XRE family transcriptional regulator n=1 Tax=Roseivivax isoporae LMG 25204 TaxID=1449351 RepID=X7FF54_9RHOB|nr:helix-turn-helix transcriptional regulator [Roseivivax isoporae]ETX30711.1 XRE family transcriptional regulator [Roseivivax isoporae LMG 25204]
MLAETPVPSPAELRDILGDNLRKLTDSTEGSVSALCRELGINRTQFNRYRAGESFPRPDVLHRICTHFGVDARILLQPVEEVMRLRDGALGHPELAQFLGAGLTLTESAFPSGFYRMTHPADPAPERYVLRVFRVYRRDGLVFFRGFDPVAMAQAAGRSVLRRDREYRGAAFRQDKGIAALGSRRNAEGATFSYLDRVVAGGVRVWVGHTSRSGRDVLSAGPTIALICEHLGRRVADALPSMRVSGLHLLDDLPDPHRMLHARVEG